MKPYLLFISLFLLGLNNPNATEPKVYICKGKGSKRYHYKKHCRGLSNCSTKVYGIALTKAKAMGRTLCGWED